MFILGAAGSRRLVLGAEVGKSVGESSKSICIRKTAWLLAQGLRGSGSWADRRLLHQTLLSPGREKLLVGPDRSLKIIARMIY